MFDFQAPYTAMKAQPLTATEIDNHPDADRIWATIEAARASKDEDTEEMIFEHEKEKDEAKDEGYDEGYQELINFVDCIEFRWEVYEGCLVAGPEGIIPTHENDKLALEMLEHKFQQFITNINEEYDF